MSQVVTDSLGVEHEFPDEATPEQMAKAMGGSPADASRTGPGPRNSPDSGRRNRIAGRKALRGMTDAGGMTGGALASRLPLSARAAAAGLGGAVGRSAENFGASLAGYDDVPQDPMGVVRSLLDAFNEHSALEMGGGAVAGLAGAVGRGMGRHALNPSADVLKNYGDDVMETFNRERVPVGRYRKKDRKGIEIPRGSERITGRRKAASASQDLAAARHDAGGRRFSAQEVADDAITKNEMILGRPLFPAERAAVVQEVDDAMHGMVNDQMTGGLSRGPWQGYKADELLTVRQAGDRGNSPYFNRKNAGRVPGEVDPLETSVTAGSRRVLRGKVPGMDEASAETRRMMGLEQAMVEAETRKPPTLIPGMIATGAAGVGGAMGGDTWGERGASGAAGGLAGFLGTRALMDPRAMSRAGLALTDPVLLEILRQIPRSAWAGIFRPDPSDSTR